MKSIMKEIEDLSLNAWPSHQMQIYDGWILRFSYFYTHRTNSVEQFAASTLSWSEKIPYCESVYERWGTPTIFKITPLMNVDFDYMLENRGYHIEHKTNVLTMNLSEYKPHLAVTRGFVANYGSNHLSRSTTNVSGFTVEITNHITDEWINSFFDLKGMKNETHRKIVPQMYHAIPMATVCACIRDEAGRIIATGLGVLDRDYIGIYAIHCSSEHRRQGLASAIVEALLDAGMERGAKKTYLQCVDGNEGALKMYEKFGFEKIYDYWFRVK
ncbi:MAG: GNAT family N-acetyltransferase [Lachnospiraceae bacterium]|nr:GNAT family N-acetyltransferase [Lachnospiraceae bacterium]